MTKKSTTKVETREAARIRAQGRFRRLRAKVKWEGDLEQSRRSRFPSLDLSKPPGKTL